MRLRRRLFYRYALVMTALVATVLALAAATQAALAYRYHVQLVDELLEARAALAAEKIRVYVANIVAGIEPVLDLDLPGGVASPQEIRLETHRVLRRHDAVASLRYTDGERCRGIVVSRLAPDVAFDCDKDPATAAQHLPSPERFARMRGGSGSAVTFGAVEYPDGSEPQLPIAIAGRGRSTGVLEALVDLKRIHETIREIRVGETGFAYVVAEGDRLIAHPDLSRALRQMTAPTATPASISRRVAVGRPDWHVHVEQATVEALRPVYGSLLGALAVFVISVAIAIGASFLLARRLTKPIHALRSGAERIGAGDLAARIEVRTDDEIALLADEFNKMAGKLSDSYGTLERRVADRTAELAQRTHEADSANAAKTRFLASASHDLRQPMHAISLLVGLLQSRLRGTPEEPLVNKVQASAQTMENLFSGLLDISKLDAGAVKPSVMAFEIAPLLERVASHAAPQAREKGIGFSVRPCKALVASDPILLERIVTNLVSNALRYTEHGRVLVGCRRRGDALEIQVLDTGIGIAEEELDRVFEEFYQVPRVERDRSHGLGLGLSIVKRSATLLGHELHARSRVGHGSVFAVRVPLALASPAIADAGTGGEPKHAVRGAFVLVLDDERESRIPTELLFREWECHVVGAGSIDEMLTSLGEHFRTPDLIVSDYRLADGATGVDAIARIRERAESKIPAILVTGDVLTARAHLAQDDSVALLHKPVNPGRLRVVAGELIATADAA